MASHVYNYEDFIQTFHHCQQTDYLRDDYEQADDVRGCCEINIENMVNNSDGWKNKNSEFSKVESKIFQFRWYVIERWNGHFYVNVVSGWHKYYVLHLPHSLHWYTKIDLTYFLVDVTNNSIHVVIIQTLFKDLK